MAKSRKLVPGNSEITRENLKTLCCRVTEEWINVWMFILEEKGKILGIPNPFGRRKKPRLEMFWYPKKAAERLIREAKKSKSGRAAKIRLVYQYRLNYYTGMNPRAERNTSLWWYYRND